MDAPGASLNFIGNVEGKDIYSGKADIIVSDGFTGNVALKVSEGVVETLFSMARREIMKNVFAKIGFLLMKRHLKKIYKKVDYSEYGGAHLLGVNGVCIIGHGRSNSNAVRNAVRLARDFVVNRVQEKIRNEIARIGRASRRSEAEMIFSDRISLVTGASQGIGEAIALDFASEGATVVLVDIQKEKLERSPRASPPPAAGPPGSPADVTKLDQAAAVRSRPSSDVREDRSPGQQRRDHQGQPPHAHEGGGMGRRPGRQPQGRLQLHQGRHPAHDQGPLRAGSSTSPRWSG